MKNITQDGVATSLQLDEESGVLYVMGSFNRLTKTGEFCAGLAAYEIETDHWTCLADAAHSVLPSGGGNMLLTPYGLMVAGRVTSSTTWPDRDRPYTIALLAVKAKEDNETDIDNDVKISGNSKPRDDDKNDKRDKMKFLDDQSSSSKPSRPHHEFVWSWLPGFDGWMEP